MRFRLHLVSAFGVVLFLEALPLRAEAPVSATDSGPPVAENASPHAEALPRTVEEQREDSTTNPETRRNGAEETLVPMKVYPAYKAYAGEVRLERYASAIGFGIAGTGAVVTAAAGIPEDQFTRTYLFLAGGWALLASLINVFPTSSEVTVQKLQGGPCCDRSQEEALHAQWVKEADKAKTSRRTIGVIGLILGAANTTLGVVVLALDDPDFTQPARGNLAAFGLVSGAFFLGAGSTLLISPSTPERTLASFEASSEAISSRPRSEGFAFAPTPGGAGLAFTGSF